LSSKIAYICHLAAERRDLFSLEFSTASSFRPKRSEVEKPAFLPFRCDEVTHRIQDIPTYNATGGAENGGDPLSAATGAGPVLADRFVNPFDGTLTSVELNLRLSPGASAGQGFTVDLFADAGAAGPGAPLVQIASVLDTSLTSGFSLMTFTGPSPIVR
jgi:hypothetical protein